MADQTQQLKAETVKLQLQKNQNLLAVSKLQPIEKIKHLYAAGQLDFGENYIQEALEKIERLKHLPIRWHLIGPIQKNKVKFIKNNFEYIHSIDSVQLAELVSKKSDEIGHVQKVFLQLNLTGETTKSGFTETKLLENWKLLQSLHGINIVGLMTMPPLQNNPEENRAFFKKCFLIGKKLNLKEFSMGTSHDYKVALDEGATWIRLGTILFGERLQNDTSST